MIKVGLKEELEKKKKKSIGSSDELVKETQLLLEAGADSEKKALRIAKLDHQIKYVETSKGIEIEREKFESEYGDSVFTEDEIREICIKYDLRFFKSEYFKGRLDTQIASKLNRFIEANPEVGESSDSFYIIAPANAFDLKNRPAKPFMTIDPILVYRLPKQDKYVYIHKWGRDFTIFRRLRGIFFESTQSMWSISISFWTIVLSIIFGVYFNGFTGMWYQQLNIIWIFGVSCGLSFFTLATMFNDGEGFYKRTTSNLWNKRIKRRR
jgi:hypothetical protein